MQRIELELDDSIAGELRGLAETAGSLCGGPPLSHQDLFRAAFSFLAWGLKQKTGSKAILSRDPSTEAVVELDLVEAIRGESTSAIGAGAD